MPPPTARRRHSFSGISDPPSLPSSPYSMTSSTFSSTGPKLGRVLSLESTTQAKRDSLSSPSSFKESDSTTSSPTSPTISKHAHYRPRQQHATANNSSSANRHVPVLQGSSESESLPLSPSRKIRSPKGDDDPPPQQFAQVPECRGPPPSGSPVRQTAPSGPLPPVSQRGRHTSSDREQSGQSGSEGFSSLQPDSPTSTAASIARPGSGSGEGPVRLNDRHSYAQRDQQASSAVSQHRQQPRGALPDSPVTPGFPSDYSELPASAPLKRTIPWTTESDTSTNLPDLNRLAPDAQTSLPIKPEHVDQELDVAIRKLLDQDVFMQLLRDPLGRHRFRSWLVSTQREAMLDLWWDSEVLDQLANKVKTGAIAMHETYFNRPHRTDFQIPTAMQLGIMKDLQRVQEVSLPYTPASRVLLDRLFAEDFQLFIRKKLVEHSQVRLGTFVGNERYSDGLGDAFCITNPRLRDHPIAMVSEGFCRLTGYSRTSIIGRNCRFLQGPGTSAISVKRIQDALNAGEELTELLLNYKKDGTPFWNLLCMIPLRSVTGHLVYFLGGQINVTGPLSNSATKLGFLISGGDTTRTAEGASKLNPSEFSPTLIRHQPQLSPQLTPASPSAAAGSSQARLTGAGSVDPSVCVNPQLRRQELVSPAAQEEPDQSYQQTSFGARLKRRITKTSPASLTAHQPPKRLRLPMYPKIVKLLPGAEQRLPLEAADPDTQFETFEQTYQRVLVIRPVGREIIFVTKALLQFLGLPNQSARDLFDSALVHTDLIDLFDPSERAETRRLRQALKAAIKTGSALSVPASIRILPGSKWATRSKDFTSGGSKRIHRLKTILNLTPVLDSEGNIGAFIAIFS